MSELFAVLIVSILQSLQLIWLDLSVFSLSSNTTFHLHKLPYVNLK